METVYICAVIFVLFWKNISEVVGFSQRLQLPAEADRLRWVNHMLNWVE